MPGRGEWLQDTYANALRRFCEDPEEWKRFLHAAGRNFRLRFDELVCLYMQRPDATAVMEIPGWNKYGYYVNRGATAMVTFYGGPVSANRQIRYFFDIADVHPSLSARPLPLWEREEADDASLLEILPETFGELENQETLLQALYGSVNNILNEQAQTIMDGFVYDPEQDPASPLPEQDARRLYLILARNSAIYTILERLQMQIPDPELQARWFNGMEHMTPDMLQSVGIAAQRITETVLHTVSRQIRRNRAQARQERTERSEEHGSNDEQTEDERDREDTDGDRGSSPQETDRGLRVHAGRGLLPAEPANAGAVDHGTGPVRESETRLSGGTQAVLVRGDDHERDAYGAPAIHRGESTGDGGNAHGEVHAAGESDGRTEEPRSDGMGTETESDSGEGRGDRDGGSDLQLNLLPSVEEQQEVIEAGTQTSRPFLITQEMIDEVLQRGSLVENGKLRIQAQMEKHATEKENAAFLKNEYGIGGQSPVLPEYGINMDFNSAGLRIRQGYSDDSIHVDLSWRQVAKRIQTLVDLNRYLNPAEQGAYREWRETHTKPVETEPAEPQEQKEENERLKLEKEAASRYDIGYGHLGNGLTVWNQKEEVDGDYRTVAHIAPDRTVTFYDADMPESVRAQIMKIAETSNASISATQDAPVFSTPPKEEALPRNEAVEEMDDFFNIDAAAVREQLERGNSPAVDAMLKAAEEAYAQSDEPSYERFKIIETEGGYAVWDDIKDGYYVNGDGVTEEFSSRWQAEDYLARVRKETADREAEEWLYVERAKQAPMMEPETGKQPEEPAAYAYEPGDTVYIGAHEYDIMTVEDDMVRLYDPSFPLYTKEMRREDFEKELAASPQNDRYQVVESEPSETITEPEEPEAPAEEETAPSFEAMEFEKRLPYRMRFKEVDPVEDGKAIYWVTQEPFTLQDLETFQKAVREYGGEIQTFYVTVRDLSYVYDFAEDQERHILARVTPDTMESEDYVRAIHEIGLEAYLIPEEPTADRQSETAERILLHPETPEDARTDLDLTTVQLDVVGKKKRFYRNLEAIQVLQKCREQNRLATPEEQRILCQYVGWGGLSEAFDEHNADWETQYLELSIVLTPEEYRAARASTRTAFYTPPVVISAMYQALEQMGLKTGNILEPSCGIGNFIGMRPESMRDCRMYGVEIDALSAEIAQQLYQTASIAHQPFEDAKLPDSFFDAAIGNVPFGDSQVYDPRYNRYHFLIHDYFFAKTLDKIRPGGVMALITSKGTMDKADPSVRQYIAERAELLGAIRLPNTVFRDQAGTEVVSDILFLQKRERLTAVSRTWTETVVDPSTGSRINRYFIEHPDMILGTMRSVSGRFGQDVTCEPIMEIPFSEQLAGAIRNIRGTIPEYEVEEETLPEGVIPADPAVRNYSYALLNGQIYYREHSLMRPVNLTGEKQERMEAMIRLRDHVWMMLQDQIEGKPETLLAAERTELNRQYDAFSERFGLLNGKDSKAVFKDDDSYSLLCSLEILNEDGSLREKAAIFTRQTVRPQQTVTRVDTAMEALSLSMAGKGRVDMSYMQNLTGRTPEQLYGELQGVIFRNPAADRNPQEDLYQTADAYLSGNVREKLREAQQAAVADPTTYQINVEALEKVQPEDLLPEEINVQLGSTWVPEDVYTDFVQELLKPPQFRYGNVAVRYSPVTGEWKIENVIANIGQLAFITYGTDKMDAYEIIETTLNLRNVEVRKTIRNANGEEIRVRDDVETEKARTKQEQIRKVFADWIWKDPERREMLTRIYNERFNSVRLREYDGSALQFVGMNPEIDLYPHQKNGVARILYNGNTLLPHPVGAGKTFVMIAAAMEMKRLGLCQKSMFVVPNHLTEQWGRQFTLLYPGARVLVATKQDFETANRKRFISRIATGDYDAVIIGHSQFEKIPLSRERQQMELLKQIDDLVEAISAIRYAQGSRFSIKAMEKTRNALQVRLKKLNDDTRKDDLVTFEQLGVDRLFVDEAHYYKNLYFHTKMRNVGGLQQSEAMKSSDLFMKCRYLDEKTGNRGVIFASATPVSNSIVEMYTLQRYLQYDELEKRGLQHFDAWSSTFAEAVESQELKPEGNGYRMKTRLARFHNIPELMTMYRMFADSVNTQDLNLDVPEAHYHTEVLKASPLQKEMVAELGERADAIRNRKAKDGDNMLLITGEGRKLALDPRVVDPELQDPEAGKIDRCVDNVYRIWKNTESQTQLIFCDLSTPRKGVFNVYDDIRQKLIECGVPAEQIRFVHEADTGVKKEALFQKVRDGSVRILLGSTQKLGVGTNVQDRLIAMHDLDCPWRPSDLDQRKGRIIRQGNQNPEVEIYRYVTESTFDAYMYQLLEQKSRFIQQITTGDCMLRDAENVDEVTLSYAEIKMLTAGDPRIKERMDLEVQVHRLQNQKSQYLTEKRQAQNWIVSVYPKRILQEKTEWEQLKEDVQEAAVNPQGTDGAFCGIRIGNRQYTDRGEGGRALVDLCRQCTNDNDLVHLGTYRGFVLTAERSLYTTYVILHGAGRYSVESSESPSGMLRRLDNALDKLPNKLKEAEIDITSTEQQKEALTESLKLPFAKEQELAEKTKRLKQLDAEMNGPEPEIVLQDPEPEPVEEERENLRQDAVQAR